MFKTILLTVVLGFLFSAVRGQAGDSSIVRKKYFTKPLAGSITLDGIPSEEAWNAVEWSGDFIQLQPAEGKAPTYPSAFKILYDEKYLYVAYRCYDLVPDSIITAMPGCVREPEGCGLMDTPGDSNVHGRPSLPSIISGA